jgi:protein TonB
MIRYGLLFLFVLPALAARSQDTTYYDKDGNRVTGSSVFDSYSVCVLDSGDSAQATVRSFDRSGRPEMTEHYADYHKKLLDGDFEQYYPDGRLHILGCYKQGRLDGELKSYWDNGRLKRDDFFSDDYLVRGRCFDSTGAALPHTPFVVMADFPGGLPAMRNYLSMMIRYPKVARENGIEGEVEVQFTIEPDGRVDNVKVIRGVAPKIDAEAVKVVKHMPRWQPGLLDDQPVAVQHTLPINFQLQDIRRF